VGDAEGVDVEEVVGVAVGLAVAVCVSVMVTVAEAVGVVKHLKSALSWVHLPPQAAIGCHMCVHRRKDLTKFLRVSFLNVNVRRYSQMPQSGHRKL
jgi:hypothetical protein